MELQTWLGLLGTMQYKQTPTQRLHLPQATSVFLHHSHTAWTPLWKNKPVTKFHGLHVAQKVSHTPPPQLECDPQCFILPDHSQSKTTILTHGGVLYVADCCHHCDRNDLNDKADIHFDCGGSKYADESNIN